MGNLYQLYLVRHGETSWSLTGQHTGRTDIPLTAQGEEQARNLAPWLELVHFEKILVSPRLRARQTCELAGLGSASEMEPDLAEWDYGIYEGMRSVDICKTRPDWNIWSDGCPGGESPIDIDIRIHRLIARLSKTSGNIALFTHGQFGAALAARWINLALIDGQHFELHPASLSILGFEFTHPNVRVIKLWNALPPTSLRRPQKTLDGLFPESNQTKELIYHG